MLVDVVSVALKRPYTFVVMALLMLVLGPLAAVRTPTDIFPEIRIPVIAVAWAYTGVPPDQMAVANVRPFLAGKAWIACLVQRLAHQIL